MTPKGIVLSINTNAQRIFGYTSDEIVGQNIKILCDYPHCDLHDEYLHTYMKKKKAGIKESSVIGKCRNLTARHHDGSPITISLEVEERMEGELVLVGRVSAISDEMEAFCTIDENGIIQSVNKAFWRIFGYHRKDLVGTNIKILMGHPHKELHDTYMRRYKRTGKKKIIGTKRVLKARHSDGSYFYIYLEVTEFEANGEKFFGGKITRALSSYGKKKNERIEGKKHIGNYLMTKVITSGLFGDVTLATHELTGEQVIIKEIVKSKVDEEFREVAIMQQLRHPNIAHLLEVIEGNDKIFIVMQYVGGGELYDYAMKKDKLPEDEARRFWRQLVQAVQYMHDRGAVHRDLKLENIMLDSWFNVVVIDMGLSEFHNKHKLMTTFCGSTSYAAPEMFLCRKYFGPEVDVWSMGVILYCLILGYLPFEDPQHIVDANPIPLTPEEGCSEELEDLFEKIFIFEGSERITLEGIRTHPWTNLGCEELPRSKADNIRVEPPNEEELAQLKDFGFDIDDIQRSVSEGEFNQITASLYLLRQKKSLSELRAKEDNKTDKPNKGKEKA
eukprot:CAMPEP_0174263604 /NCGR_PEP_ID=MMETSP0439-20130205/19299_1 /TAXON_ID=0 /ORGANISM="Stereomyxa ramosa, Strain Chinc5" /LENGTH=557 /DNA_ID=CAMNT_0015349029 /DNA_START=335 /DNA_END=2008 /DNA_ORIENTATION=+